jgi:hypothetical protein
MKACRYSSTLSLASAVDSAAWSRLCSRRFNLRKREPVPTLQEVGRASRPDNNNNNNNIICGFNVYVVLFLFNNVIYVFLLYDCMFMYDYPD